MGSVTLVMWRRLREVCSRQTQSFRQPRRRPSGIGRPIPVIGRVFPAPIAAKVPEIIFLFWVVKILTTAGGEVASDYLKIYGNFGGGGTEVALFVIALVLQFATRRYRAFAYWSLAYAIAIAGTGLSDFVRLDLHIPYAGTTLLWALILAALFWIWQRSEGTLSIHSITTQRREAFYWAVVFATFALGTALGDFTAASLGMGYLASGVLFFAVILLPALAWWRLGLNGTAAFWMAYVVTRPLGASFADCISKPHSMTGIGFGNGQTALVIALAVFGPGVVPGNRPARYPAPRRCRRRGRTRADYHAAAHHRGARTRSRVGTFESPPDRTDVDVGGGARTWDSGGRGRRAGLQDEQAQGELGPRPRHGRGRPTVSHHSFGLADDDRGRHRQTPDYLLRETPMALTEEQARVKAAYEAVQDTFPTAGYAYVLACRRQLPEIDSPEMLAEYRRLADEAEALAAMLAASRQAT